MFKVLYNKFIIWGDNMERFIFIIGLIAAIVIAILYLKKMQDKKMQKIIDNTPKKRFKYLDTFYYFITIKNGNSNSTIYHFYVVLEDMDDNKIYAIPDPMFRNAMSINIAGKFSIIKGKSKQPVIHQDQGSFWIQQTLDNYYYRSNDIVAINNTQLTYSNNPNKEYPILYHI